MNTSSWGALLRDNRFSVEERGTARTLECAWQVRLDDGTEKPFDGIGEMVLHGREHEELEARAEAKVRRKVKGHMSRGVQEYVVAPVVALNQAPTWTLVSRGVCYHY